MRKAPLEDFKAEHTLFFDISPKRKLYSNTSYLFQNMKGQKHPKHNGYTIALQLVVLNLKTGAYISRHKC